MTEYNMKKVLLQSVEGDALAPIAYSAKYSSGGLDIDNDTLGKKQIAGCVLEAPRRNINLSIVNNQLILKAGSIVCFPDGFEADGVTPKFRDLIIQSDLYMPVDSTSNGKFFVYVSEDGTRLMYEFVSMGQSGTTWTPTTWTLWYDTNVNKIKRYEGDTTNYFTVSIPVCDIHVSNGTIDYYEKRDRIGFMGTSLFVYPGLKVLIPNGRNADGSLRNIECTVDRVLTSTQDKAYNQNRTCYIFLNSAKKPWYDNAGYIQFRTYMDDLVATNNQRVYSSATNSYYYCESGTSSWVQHSTPFTMIGYLETGNGYIGYANALEPVNINNDYWGKDMKFVQIANTSGTINLSLNTAHNVYISGPTTFSMPVRQIDQRDKTNQMFVQIHMDGVYSINLGTTHFFNNKTPNLSSAGSYNLYYEWDQLRSVWVCGSMQKG